MSSPTLLSSQRYESGADAAASDGILVVPNTTIHTKATSYTTLIAATAFRASGLLITSLTGSAAQAQLLYDIAIGAISSEQIIIANLRFNMHASSFGSCVFIPIAIPAGVRLSARAQASGSSNSGELGLVVQLVGGGVLDPLGLQLCSTFGADTTDTSGADVDPGAVAHTEGAFTELTAATTHPIKWLAISQSSRKNAAHAANTTWLMDVAIGGAGVEQVIIPDLAFVSKTTNQGFHPEYWSLPVDIPTGSRIAVRAQCDITDATDRLFDVILYGVG